MLVSNDWTEKTEAGFDNSLGLGQKGGRRRLAMPREEEGEKRDAMPEKSAEER